MTRWSLKQRYGLAVTAVVSIGILGFVLIFFAEDFRASIPAAMIALPVVGITNLLSVQNDRTKRRQISTLLDKVEELSLLHETETSAQAQLIDILRGELDLSGRALKLAGGHVAWIDLGGSGRVIGTSGATEMLLGRSSDDLVGHRFDNFASSVDAQSWENIRTEIDKPIDLVFRRPDGAAERVTASIYRVEITDHEPPTYRLFLKPTGESEREQAKAEWRETLFAAVTGALGLFDQNGRALAVSETMSLVLKELSAGRLLEHVKGGTCPRLASGRVLKPSATTLPTGETLLEVSDITGSLETSARIAAFARSVHAIEVLRDGTIVWAAATLADLVGKTKLEGEKIDSILPPDEEDTPISARIKQALVGEPTQVMGISAVVNDRQVALHLTSCRDKASVLISVEIETTDQRFARRQLPAAEAAEDLFPMAVSDGRGRITKANGKLSDLLGKPISDLVGSQLSDLASLDEARGSQAAHIEALKVERQDQTPLRLERHYSRQGPETIVHFFVDRTKDWERLQRTVGQAALLNAFAPPVMTVEEGDTVSIVSPTLATLLADWAPALMTAFDDFAPEAVEGGNVEDLFGADEELVRFLSGMSLNEEQALFTFGGETISLRRSPVNAHGSSVVEWRNVTSERLDDRVRQTFENCHAAAFLSIDGKIESTTAKYCEILGYGEDEITGTDLEEIFDPTFVRMGAFGDYWESVVSGTSGGARVERNRKDGQKVYLHSHHTPIFDDDGKVVKVVEALTDITVFQEERRDHEVQQRALLTEQREVIGSFGDGIKRLSEGDFSVDLGASLPEAYAEMREDFTRAVASLAEADALRRAVKQKQEMVVSLLAQALSDLTDGFLTHRIRETFPEEYEQIRVDFNDAIERLGIIVSLIAATSEDIRQGANQLLLSADDLSRRTEGQAANLEQTAKSVDLIATAVSETAEKAGRVNEIAEDARSKARSSGKVVRDAVEAMAEIERSSNAINSILSIIDDIAFQTNLLALNAGVEAARAGDAGRGFAVVAQEVRALAQRSADSAREIKSLIDSSTERVEQGVSLVRSTGETLDGILTSVEEVSEGVNSIATSAQEQASSLSEINDAVGKVDEVTQQNAAMVEESSRVGHQLAKAARALTEHIKHFSLSEQEAAVVGVDHAPRLTTPSSERVVEPKEALERSPVFNAPLTEGNLAVDPDWQEF